jgi:uncharacterized protein YceK
MQTAYVDPINCFVQRFARALKILSALLVVILLTGCSTISFEQPKTVTHVFTDTGDTAFGRHLAEWNAEHQGLPSAPSMFSIS